MSAVKKQPDKAAFEIKKGNIAVTQASYTKSVSEVQIGALDLVAEKLATRPYATKMQQNGR